MIDGAEHQHAAAANRPLSFGMKDSARLAVISGRFFTIGGLFFLSLSVLLNVLTNVLDNNNLNECWFDTLRSDSCGNTRRLRGEL